MSRWFIPKWPSTHAPSHTTIKTFLNSFYLLLFILLNVPLPVSLVTFFLKAWSLQKERKDGRVCYSSKLYRHFCHCWLRHCGGKEGQRLLGPEKQGWRYPFDLGFVSKSFQVLGGLLPTLPRFLTRCRITSSDSWQKLISGNYKKIITTDRSVMLQPIDSEWRLPSLSLIVSLFKWDRPTRRILKGPSRKRAQRHNKQIFVWIFSFGEHWEECTYDLGTLSFTF